MMFLYNPQGDKVSVAESQRLALLRQGWTLKPPVVEVPKKSTPKVEKQDVVVETTAVAEDVETEDAPKRKYRKSSSE